MTTDLALQALLMDVWRRTPDGQDTVHSDQGLQFTSREWQMFLRQHDLEPSMSRRGNSHDNAVAESFSQLLKRERIWRQTYPTREDAGRDMFEYIELFYNPKRKQSNNGMLSPPLGDVCIACRLWLTSKSDSTNWPRQACRKLGAIHT